MKILVAHDKKRVIGHCGEMPFDVQVDRRVFWALTLGQAIIMGRRTYDSLPRRPLPGRHNIVISTTLPSMNVAGIHIVSSPEEAFDKYPNAWVVGGQMVYEAALATGKVDTILATLIPGEHRGDCFFPELPGWRKRLYLRLPECEFWSMTPKQEAR